MTWLYSLIFALFLVDFLVWFDGGFGSESFMEIIEDGFGDEFESSNAECDY